MSPDQDANGGSDPPGQSLRQRIVQLEQKNQELSEEIERLRQSTQSATVPHDALGRLADTHADQIERLAEQLVEQTGKSTQAEQEPAETDDSQNRELAHSQELAEMLDLAHDTIIVHDLQGRVVFWNRGAESTYGWSKQEAIGKTTHTLLRTRFSAPLTEVTAALLRDDRWDGELVHTAGDGRRIVAASRWALRRDKKGEPVAILEIDRDITSQKEAYEQLAAAQRRLFSVLNMMPGYVALIDRAYAIRFVNDGFLEAFSEPGDRPCYQVQHGLDEPCDDCPLLEILQKRQPRNWEATYANGRSYHVWGYPFTDIDGTSLVLELGLDITERRELERMLSDAAERERRRVGRDLHDALGQNLTGVSYLISSLAERLVGEMPQERANLHQITQTLKESISHVRALARGLNPLGLEEGGLHDALRELASQSSQLSDISCRFECRERVDIDESAATQLYHIAQEAITNAMKHSAAKRVIIRLTSSEHSVTLQVVDYGKGIQQDLDATEGMGLRVMRYRAAAVGGRLSVKPDQLGGTVVTCTVPKRPRAQPDEARG